MDSADTRPLVMSHTPGALQRNWKVPALFPLCPSTSVEAPIKTYFEALYIGDIAVDGPYGETMIDDVTLHPDGNSILILGDFGEGAFAPNFHHDHFGEFLRELLEFGFELAAIRFNYG